MLPPTRLLTALQVALLLGCAPGRHSSDTAGERPARPASSEAAHVIEGIVRNEQNDRPLAGVQVGLYRDSAGRALIAGAVTDSMGTYRLVDVPAGAYWLRARRLDFAPALRSVDVGSCGTTRCVDRIRRSFYLEPLGGF